MYIKCDKLSSEAEGKL